MQVNDNKCDESYSQTNEDIQICIKEKEFCNLGFGYLSFLQSNIRNIELNQIGSWVNNKLIFALLIISQFSASSVGSQKPLNLGDISWMPDFKQLLDKKITVENKQSTPRIEPSTDSEAEEEGIFKFYEEEVAEAKQKAIKNSK